LKQLDQLKKSLKDVEILAEIHQRHSVLVDKMIKENREDLEADYPGLMDEIKDLAEKRDMKGLKKKIKELSKPK